MYFKTKAIIYLNDFTIRNYLLMVHDEYVNFHKLKVAYVLRKALTLKLIVTLDLILT